MNGFAAQKPLAVILIVYGIAGIDTKAESKFKMLFRII